ncbi:MAG: hypothetical protein RLZ23_1159, partial [Actinomycetota bacterium]
PPRPRRAARGRAGVREARHASDELRQRRHTLCIVDRSRVAAIQARPAQCTARRRCLRPAGTRCRRRCRHHRHLCSFQRNIVASAFALKMTCSLLKLDVAYFLADYQVTQMRLKFGCRTYLTSWTPSAAALMPQIKESARYQNAVELFLL